MPKYMYYGMDCKSLTFLMITLLCKKQILTKLDLNVFLGFNEIAQFLSKSEVLVALSVFSSQYFFHQ